MFSVLKNSTHKMRPGGFHNIYGCTISMVNPVAISIDIVQLLPLDIVNVGLSGTISIDIMTLLPLDIVTPSHQGVLA